MIDFKSELKETMAVFDEIVVVSGGKDEEHLTNKIIEMVVLAKIGVIAGIGSHKIEGEDRLGVILSDTNSPKKCFFIHPDLAVTIGALMFAKIRGRLADLQSGKTLEDGVDEDFVERSRIVAGLFMMNATVAATVIGKTTEANSSQIGEAVSKVCENFINLCEILKETAAKTSPMTIVEAVMKSLFGEGGRYSSKKIKDENIVPSEGGSPLSKDGKYYKCNSCDKWHRVSGIPPLIDKESYFASCRKDLKVYQTASEIPDEIKNSIESLMYAEHGNPKFMGSLVSHQTEEDQLAFIIVYGKDHMEAAAFLPESIHDIACKIEKSSTVGNWVIAEIIKQYVNETKEKPLLKKYEEAQTVLARITNNIESDPDVMFAINNSKNKTPGNRVVH